MPYTCYALCKVPSPIMNTPCEKAMLKACACLHTTWSFHATAMLHGTDTRLDEPPTAPRLAHMQKLGCVQAHLILNGFVLDPPGLCWVQTFQC